ncbi:MULTISPECIES: response regulator [unclassified Spirosoma]|uniref:response regulator n=1 Tax=unclassified Spirosoma TaxID=2621999 RepID=UPI000966CFB1|nr:MULTISPECIES: response regulator [unclassified Spirosoma]MBN8826693.1 response regulator [Spirosoma sp.]OJW75058.1 MAG: response regulator [Spirosoma sp. 48-14]
MPAKLPILLVDDDPQLVEILNRAASQVFPLAHFIQISSFAEAATYLDALKEHGPRLVLLDIDLKDKQSGFDFLSLLREHPQGKMVPVVMLSVESDEQIAEEAYTFGANAFTQKPDTYADWKKYVKLLKLYWFETVTIPKIWLKS